ncbi:hypothetical protein H6A68_06810 [Bifidobacterium pullorum subsp. saeculare]|uniref:hypothetical protein n=1 Tax=Bifidobacterium pullorum TaxID=78448 RepID=UPI00195AA2E1|nr:hypothetical protein [Bifidobacterium pullorum]MBM6706756.1 hypothetical protein [Bifidobacterium pullorum subsp. saeculare]
MMDNGSLPPYAVTKDAYDLLCEPLCASDLQALHKLLSESSVKLSESSVKKYFANTFGAESEKDVLDWTEKVWAPYVEFLTGMNEKGEDIPDKPGVFFSSCSSWVANFDPEICADDPEICADDPEICADDPEICADDPETRPEKLWDRFLEEDLPLRRNIVMLYPNWGGDLSRKRSADDNGDWTGLYGSEKESKSQRSVAWRNFHTKEEVTQWRDPRSRFSAMAVGPIAGAYWTDFYKFIPTPNTSSLNNFLKFAKNEKIYDELEKLMLTLFVHELERLDGNADPIPSQESRVFNRLILATTDPYDILRSHDLSKYGLKPWCLIRWPHHSGLNSGTFKATTLAYAYGRVERALEYVEQRKPEEAWPWPFKAVIGKDSAHLIPASDTLPSLYDWLAEGCGAGHLVLLERAMRRAGNYFDAPDKVVVSKVVVSGLLDDASDAALEAWKGNKGSKASKVCFASVKEALFGADDPREWFENDDKKEVKVELAANELDEFEFWFDTQTPTREETVDWLCGFSGVMSGPGKTVFTKEDVDAAFLLGWRNEDKLVPFLKDGEWHVPDAFDKTLMPAPKDLVSVKEELAEMRKKQG